MPLEARKPISRRLANINAMRRFTPDDEFAKARKQRIFTGSRTSCPPAGAARSDLTEQSRRNICALRAGGQDVRDPISQGTSEPEREGLIPGFLSKLKLLFEGTPQDPGGAAFKLNEESPRKGMAFPHMRRQSRYAAFAIYHLPFTIKSPC